MTLVASIVPLVANGALITMMVAVCIAFVRLALGPGLMDRVVALDLIAMLLVGAFVLHGVTQPEPISLRVATVLALLNFLGTVGFAIYVRRMAD